MKLLRVGDTVIWRGAWGRERPRRAHVIALEETDAPRSKYGEPVLAIPWDRMAYAVVTLDNGHWAYGEQLSPIREDHP